MLKTARLMLRPPVHADALTMAALAGDWDIASMTGQLPYPYTLANAERYIAELPKDDTLELAFSILLNGHLIGVCGYAALNLEAAGIGYWIGKPYWGQGFATQAASAMIDYCFDHVGFASLTCSHFVGNVASARVIEKLGFSPTGPGISRCEATQTNRETRTYRLERKTYRAARIT
jgi:[ribosomal protein S5]-alanine N-acetyltransferase